MKNITPFQKWLLCSFFLAICLTSAMSQWTVEQMPTQHAQFSAVALGDRVFFGPASTFSGFQTHVDIYNVQYVGWEETMEVSAPRCNAAGVVANGKVYFAGGLAISWLNPTMLDVVDIYDTLSGEWTVATLSEGRSELKAVHAGEKLLFAGGVTDIDGDFSSLTEIFTSSTVDILNLTTEEWSNVSLSQPRVGIAAAAWGDFAVFAGGQTASGLVTDVIDIYNATTDTWSILKLSEPKGWCEAAALDGKIYVAGGVTGDLMVTDKVEILNLETMSWDSATLSEPRGGIRSGVMGSKIFFAGGGKYNLTQYIWTSPFSARVDIYDASTGEWTTDNLQTGRINHSAAVAGNKLFVAGGAPSFGEVEIFTDSTFTGLHEHLEDITVSLFPNPVFDDLSILIQTDKLETFQVQVFDVTEKLLNAFRVQGGTAASVSMANLKNGAYILKIFNENGMAVEKLIKS